jgi:integrase
MDKRSLSERDICTKFITPALRRAGWNEMSQIREEVTFTKGRIIVRGNLVSSGKGKRADYILYYKPNIPIAIIEAKDIERLAMHDLRREAASRLLEHGVDLMTVSMLLGHQKTATTDTYLRGREDVLQSNCRSTTSVNRRARTRTSGSAA